MLPVQNTLGECVLWHEQQQAIYWLDIEGATLQKHLVSTQQIETFKLPFRAGCFAFLDNSHFPKDIIIAFAQGIARYNVQTEEINWLSQPEINILGNRFNDGRADRQGRFWAGTMIEDSLNDEQQAHLYCLDHQLTCQKVISEISISNSLCWSKNSKFLYHADSQAHKIYQYDFCQHTGNISNKQLFAQTDDNAFPDGSTIDAQDHLWNAQWGSSNVVRYNPKGEQDLVLTLPVTQPSCIAIGGPNLDWLIVSSARHSLSEQALKEQPLAGNIFIYQLHNIQGIPEPKCTI